MVFTKKSKPCSATLPFFEFFEFLKLFPVLGSPIWNSLLSTSAWLNLMGINLNLSPLEEPSL